MHPGRGPVWQWACRHYPLKPLLVKAMCRALRPHAGNILDTWFGRTVIRSCAKLSYPMVQVGGGRRGGGGAAWSGLSGLRVGTAKKEGGRGPLGAAGLGAGGKDVVPVYQVGGRHLAFCAMSGEPDTDGYHDRLPQQTPPRLPTRAVRSVLHTCTPRRSNVTTQCGPSPVPPPPPPPCTGHDRGPVQPLRLARVHTGRGHQLGGGAGPGLGARGKESGGSVRYAVHVALSTVRRPDHRRQGVGGEHCRCAEGALASAEPQQQPILPAKLAPHPCTRLLILSFVPSPVLSPSPAHLPTCPPGHGRQPHAVVHRLAAAGRALRGRRAAAGRHQDVLHAGQGRQPRGGGAVRAAGGDKLGRVGGGGRGAEVCVVPVEVAVAESLVIEAASWLETGRCDAGVKATHHSPTRPKPRACWPKKQLCPH